MNIINKKIELSDGRVIEIETGKLAKQADGSVVVKMGGTMLLATVCAAKEVKEGTDFMPLTVDYKEKYYAAGIEPDDLVSVGTIGLIKAVRTFRPEKAPRLSSYASRCIDNEILMYFRSLKKASRDISINEEIDSDSEGNSLTLMDILACDDTIVDDLDDNVNKEKLYVYLNECLTPRERLIIRLRYGLDGREPLAQREVASILKISRSYVSRIEKRALEKLRERYEGQ